MMSFDSGPKIASIASRLSALAASTSVVAAASGDTNVLGAARVCVSAGFGCLLQETVRTIDAASPQAARQRVIPPLNDRIATLLRVPFAAMVGTWLPPETAASAEAATEATTATPAASPASTTPSPGTGGPVTPAAAGKVRPGAIAVATERGSSATRVLRSPTTYGVRIRPARLVPRIPTAGVAAVYVDRIAAHIGTSVVVGGVIATGVIATVVVVVAVVVVSVVIGVISVV